MRKANYIDKSYFFCRGKVYFPLEVDLGITGSFSVFWTWAAEQEFSCWQHTHTQYAYLKNKRTKTKPVKKKTNLCFSVFCVSWHLFLPPVFPFSLPQSLSLSSPSFLPSLLPFSIPSFLSFLAILPCVFIFRLETILSRLNLRYCNHSTLVT